MLSHKLINHFFAHHMELIQGSRFGEAQTRAELMFETEMLHQASGFRSGFIYCKRYLDDLIEAFEQNDFNKVHAIILELRDIEKKANDKFL